MGCYGIGITRTLQAVIEQCNDKDGIIWPLAIAPYQVLHHPAQRRPGKPGDETGGTILQRTRSKKAFEVILDDRDDRPGVKFKDADLVGFPIRIALGEKIARQRRNRGETPRRGK